MTLALVLGLAVGYVMAPLFVYWVEAWECRRAWRSEPESMPRFHAARKERYR